MVENINTNTTNSNFDWTLLEIIVLSKTKMLGYTYIRKNTLLVVYTQIKC